MVIQDWVNETSIGAFARVRGLWKKHGARAMLQEQEVAQRWWGTLCLLYRVGYKRNRYRLHYF